MPRKFSTQCHLPYSYNLLPQVSAFCQQHPWAQAHALGAKRGAEMVALASLARAMVNPGEVGLTMALALPDVFAAACGGRLTVVFG